MLIRRNPKNPAYLFLALLFFTSFAQTRADSAAPADYPSNERWRTFAKPLARGSSSLTLFQRYFGGALVHQIDWKTKKTNSSELPELMLYNGKDLRYTALASQEGLWLLGETSMLVLPNGQQLPPLWTRYEEPVAVVLEDQSVLVLGSSLYGKEGDTYRLEQLRRSKSGDRLEIVDRGILSYDGKPNQSGQLNRVPRYGHSAVKLRDGRVLMLGGSGTGTRVSLIEPSVKDGAWVIKPLEAMPNERVFGAALVLPDDRVIVTGTPHLNCHGEAAKMRSVDMYNVQTNRWSSLPPLPFVPCTNAYGADAPAITTTPNGSLVVGGHLEPNVMLLSRDTRTPTGYANSWRVHGHMPRSRISGVVQALSNQEVVVAGGVDDIKELSPSCCYATAGYDRVNLTETVSSESLAMRFTGPGVAQRGHMLFVASGRRFISTSSGQLHYSAHAELIDLATGKVRQLPNVPFTSGAAQAFWLDKDRVLLKGVKESVGGGFDLGQSRSSYIPPSSDAMAIFNVKENRWSEPLALPELEQAQLIAAMENEAWLLSTAQIPTQVLRLELDTRKVEVVGQVERTRRYGMARLLPNGKLVLAGGEVQGHTVSVLDPACKATEGHDCPERFTGFGGFAQLAVIETLWLGKGVSSILSAPNSDHVVSTVITAEGRAIVLSRDPPETNPTGPISIFRSSLDGRSWEAIPLPSDLNDQRCDSCVLMSAANPQRPSEDLIFFSRRGSIDYIDDEFEAQARLVWWWHEAEKKWHKVLSSNIKPNPLNARALGGPLSSLYGKRMLSTGWHLRAPVLWMEQ